MLNELIIRGKACCQLRDFLLGRPTADIDLFKGRKDLQRGRVRMTSDAVFTADTIRILRGFRFCARLGFTLDPATQQRLQEQALDLAEKMHRGNDSH